MKKIVLVLIAISLVAVSCNKSTQLTIDAKVQIKEKTIAVQYADTPQKREQGLGGINSISDEEGMLFLFSAPQTPQFWMKGMKFPIDIIWINGNTIVGITDSARPEPGRSDNDLTRYAAPAPVDKVLEVNAGWALRKDVNAGDTIKITPAS